MLTGRQQEIWSFLTQYVDEHGYPPTVREIGEAVGLASHSTVHAHLANLERVGLIKRDPTKPRALELRRDPKPQAAPAAAEDVHRLPLVGEIAAGGPLLAEQNVEDYLAVPEPLARGGEEFLLRVKGDSMINAGILEGDLVVVRRQQTARDGEIVVALAGQDETADEATVKRFFRENGRVRLQPENDALAPIYPDHVQVLGVASSCCNCRTVASSAPSAAAGSAARGPPSPRSRSADQVEDEGELGAACARAQLHRAARVRVGAGAAGDRQHAVARVVERALDGDLPAREQRRPDALPGLADDHADAVALVAADLVGVRLVEDLVREGEDVADRVGRPPVVVRDGVVGGVLDHVHDLAAAVVLLAVPTTVVGERDTRRDRACDEEDDERN
jgi:repressor LexA